VMFGKNTQDEVAVVLHGQGEIAWTAAQTRTFGDNWREQRSEDMIRKTIL